MKDSGIDPVEKHNIAGLWPYRHTNVTMRKILRAAINSNQRWRQRFRRLPQL